MKLPLKLSIGFALLATLIIGLAMLGKIPRGTPMDTLAPEAHFVQQWKTQLESATNPEAAAAIVRQNKEGGKVVHLNDGTWIAVVMEHECCTGAGYNATLYVTSSGESYLDVETCYCAFMELDGEIDHHSHASIAAFLDDIRSSGKMITRL